MFVLRGLPILIELALLVYCLIDAIQSPPEKIRNLPKWGWIVLIIFFPLVGAIAWLVAGRPSRSVSAGPTGPAGGAARRGPLAPDDDPEFLAQLRAVDREQERTLDSWEADLRRREEELRRRRSEDDPPTP